MKKYQIQSRVSTGVDIFPKYNWFENDIEKRVKCNFEYDDLRFEQWSFSFAKWPHWDAWIVFYEMDAENAIDALNLFLKKLSTVLPRIFFGIPVWHSFWYHEPLIISRDNFQTGFYCLRKKREWTWLTITDEILDLLKDQDFQNIPDNFFLYYSEFINSISALSWLSLWLSALEIIRPESNEERKKLFWEGLYYKLYWKLDKRYPDRKQGIRHKIHHWLYPEEWDNLGRDYNDMHEAIRLALLKKNQNIQKIYDLRGKFVSIPRWKTVIEWFNIFLKASENCVLKIKELVTFDDANQYNFSNLIKEKYWIETDVLETIETY